MNSISKSETISKMSERPTINFHSGLRGAHAVSRAHFGALAEMLQINHGPTKVRDGEGAIASTRGACAAQPTE
jgi:hypothetical protein